MKTKVVEKALQLQEKPKVGACYIAANELFKVVSHNKVDTYVDYIFLNNPDCVERWNWKSYPCQEATPLMRELL